MSQIGPITLMNPMSPIDPISPIGLTLQPTGNKNNLQNN